jgi:dethiobiotin synthetase
MPRKIFVTATNTNVGKTHTTLLLMEEAAGRGLRPAAFKPVETGVAGIPEDGAKLLEATRRLNPGAAHLSLDDVVPLRYSLPAAPFVAKGEAPIDYGLIGAKLRKLETLCDVLFVEGAGGLLVPLDEERFMIDLPGLFGLEKTLLVSPSRLGSINDTLLSLEALRNRGIGHEVGVNLYEDAKSFEEVTLPYYEKSGMAFCLLPHERGKLLERLLA